MKRLSKYFVIVLWIICLFQIDLFAQVDNNYENKNVEIILANGRSLSGKVIKQTDDKMKLEINNENVSVEKKDIEKIIIVIENNTDIGKTNDNAIPLGINIAYRFFWVAISGMSESTQYPIVRIRCTNNLSKEIDKISFKVRFVYKINKQILSETESDLSNLPPGYSKTIDLLCEQGYGLLDLYEARRRIYAQVYINNKFYKELAPGSSS